MRARLLDLGEVGPVRSQSAYHAVLARIADDDDPVVFLVRPAGALLSIGDAGTTPGEDTSELPRVRRLIGGPTQTLDENDLLIQIVFPTAKTPTTALATASNPVLEQLADLDITATLTTTGDLETTAGTIGHVQAGVVESALAIVFSLTWNQSPPGTTAPKTSSLAAQMETPIPLAELAEKLLAALENHFALELFPSLPTPEELEAIYEWDERLLIETAADLPATPAVTAALN